MSDDAWHAEIVRRRRELCEKIGGKLVKKIERKKMPNGEIVEREKEETAGGILHWGRETENKGDLEWFRQEIKKAYGGRAPKVLDPFAGGGAIPLEAMRLGCETTAVDINPVAWFILKCTLEYPQKLAGKTYPLPNFILGNEEFMNVFYKAHPHLVGRTKKTKKQIDEDAEMFPSMVKEDSGRAPKADLAWHVRAWGRWVLDRARRELAHFYPTYADFEALEKHNPKPFEKRPMQLLPLKDDGMPDVDALNAEFSKEYLADKKNPRWVAKPTVAYLWARTVKCKNCRATLPLLKTRWLCKKEKKRVLLAMKPNAQKTGVTFGIETNVPAKGGNAAQRREQDKRIAAGTMSRSGAKCPCCGTIMTMEDIRIEGRAGRLEVVMTTVVMDGQNGKVYRLPTEYEFIQARVPQSVTATIYALLPAGVPTEQIAPASTRSISCHEYGLDSYTKLMTSRQIAFIGAIAGAIREISKYNTKGIDQAWPQAVSSFLAAVLDKCLDYGNTLSSWYTQNEQITHLFNRYALPMMWYFAEAAPFGGASGSWESMLNSVAKSVETTISGLLLETPSPVVCAKSVLDLAEEESFDAVVTDPPYYQAVSYADLSDFFYVWLRCIFVDRMEPFREAMTPKANEIVQHIREDKDRDAEKQKYEDWMAAAFGKAFRSLRDGGRFVIVFAHKDPLAWETLVAATIRSGFMVCASWPIQTEMPNRSRGHSVSALSSSVWLVCKKRPATAKPGWDNQVLDEMRLNIRNKLREFWDAGIRGPDFVWAATGPALEAYSKHPVVKKANEPGPMTVSEFLTHVRRIVVDFVVGRVLSADKEGDADIAAVDRLDEPTAYYLLHRHDFGMDEAPAGACILYAISCGISDKELSDTWGIIGFTKGKSEEDESVEADADAESNDETENDSGNKVKLKTWAQRKGKSLGYEAPSGKPIPLIDRVHCLMHLWKVGDLSKVDGYLDGNGMRRHELFKRLLQSLIELSPRGSEERSLLESLSNHVGAKGAKLPELFASGSTADTEHLGEDT
jgi:adenine-specific DNA methylase